VQFTVKWGRSQTNIACILAAISEKLMSTCCKIQHSPEKMRRNTAALL